MIKRIVTTLVLFGLTGLLFYKLNSAKNTLDARAEISKLTLYAMSDYVPKTVVEMFEKEYNCKIQYDNFSNNEELLAKLMAGATGYDVIVPSDYTVRALIEAKLVREIDPQQIPNIKNLAKDFFEVPYDQGSKHSVAYTWGTTGFIYNSEKVDGANSSLALIFDNKVKGKLSLLDDQREALGAMMHKLGYSVNSTSEREITEAKNLLKTLKSLVRIFASDPKQNLLADDVWVAQIYSGDAAQVIKQKPQFRYFTPKEGSTLWIDTMAIPTKAPHPELAHKFINFILRPDIAKIITEELLYASPNVAVDLKPENENLKPEFLKKVQLGKLEFLKDLGPKNSLWDDAWSEIKSL